MCELNRNTSHLEHSMCEKSKKNSHKKKDPMFGIFLFTQLDLNKVVIDFSYVGFL